MSDDALPDPEEMSDDTLTSEVEVLARYARHDSVTDVQATRLTALRDEVVRRSSVSGPHADYTGPEDTDE